MIRDDAIAAAGRRIDGLIAASHARSRGIGFVGPDVPIELLLASGRSFGHLPWEASGRTPWADRWLESSFPYWARSILEQWHEGRFDTFDTVVFSRAEDASQRLYYYIGELQRRGKLGGPPALLFDIALGPRDSSLAHTEKAVIELTRALDATPERLREAIARANRLRAQLSEIERGRIAAGPLYERLGRAVAWDDATQWIGEIAECVSSADTDANADANVDANVEADTDARADAESDVHADPSTGTRSRRQTAAARFSTRRRVLLAGSVPVDGRLHRAVEDGAASIVAEAHWLAMSRFGPALAADSEAAERGIARHLRQSSIAPRAFRDRAAWIVERAVAAQADAVLLWLTREDEACVWHVPSQRRALASAGIDTLVLPASRWQADEGVLDRISRFFEEKGAHATA